MNTVADRAKHLLSHKNLFGFPAEQCVSGVDLAPPAANQYILRMMVRSPETDGFRIPSEIAWLSEMIEFCETMQNRDGINNPFVYVTVRHGPVKSVTDDEWHVDGFSMRVPHIPEQNYIIASTEGTEVLEQEIRVPSDFDPMKHNIHQYFQDLADRELLELRERFLSTCSTET